MYLPSSTLGARAHTLSIIVSGFYIDEGVDYVQMTTSLSFTNTSLTNCIEFLVVGDSNPLELAEEFTISANFGPFVDTATIVIINNGM